MPPGKALCTRHNGLDQGEAYAKEFKISIVISLVYMNRALPEINSPSTDLE